MELMRPGWLPVHLNGNRAVVMWRPSGELRIVSPITGEPVCPFCKRRYDSSGEGDWTNENYFRILAQLNDDGTPARHSDPLARESFNQGYYSRFFTEEKLLGRGSGSAVFQCTHKLDGIRLSSYACKKIPVGDDHVRLGRVLQEVKMLERLHNHKNIIGFRHVWLEVVQLADVGPPVECLMILMDLANGGNLAQYIMRGSLLSNHRLISFFKDICLGLEYLQQMGIMHCDIKPENILIHREFDHSRGREADRALLSDFGISRDLQTPPHERTLATGTLEYMAPELLHADSPHTPACDLYSLGVLLYTMCFSDVPFSAGDDPDAFIAMMCSSPPPLVFPPVDPPRPPELLDLIRMLTDRDPSRRPSLDVLLSWSQMRPDRSPPLDATPKRERGATITRVPSVLLLDKQAEDGPAVKRRDWHLLGVFLMVLRMLVVIYGCGQKGASLSGVIAASTVAGVLLRGGLDTKVALLLLVLPVLLDVVWEGPCAVR